MIDPDIVMQALLRPRLDASIEVVSTLSGGEMDHLPLVSHSLSINAALARTDFVPTAWAASLELRVLALALDHARAIAEALYEIVHGWNNQWSQTHIAHLVDAQHHARAYAYVTEVEDRSVFDRGITASTGERSVTQLVGVWDLQVHQA